MASRWMPMPVDRDARQATVVHITESFASGTASAVNDFVRNFPDAQHRLIYSLRDGVDVSLDELRAFETADVLPVGAVGRIRYVRNYLTALRVPYVVHAHSSWAGMYVRLAMRNSARCPIVYTPHCYSFERLDVSRPVRQSFRLVEWLLSFNTATIACCSERERKLSLWPLSTPRAVAVPNVVPTALSTGERRHAGARLRVAGCGRIGPQKDPEFFATAVRAARTRNPAIEAVWIGGGEAHHEDLLRSSGVDVTGWVTRREALDVLASSDVYLHTALWEGFPISILEAAALGLGVIARDRPYLDGVDLPAVIERPEDLAGFLTVDRVDALDGLARKTRAALTGNTDAAQQIALKSVYSPLLERRV